MNMNTPAIPISRGRRWLRIALGVLLFMVYLALCLVFGLFLTDYEDNTSGAWTWESMSRWQSSLPPGYRTAWWVSAIGAQAPFLVCAALIVVGLYRVFKERRSARSQVD